MDLGLLRVVNAELSAVRAKPFQPDCCLVGNPRV